MGPRVSGPAGGPRTCHLPRRGDGCSPSSILLQPRPWRGGWNKTPPRVSPSPQKLIWDKFVTCPVTATLASRTGCAASDAHPCLGDSQFPRPQITAPGVRMVEPPPTPCPASAPRRRRHGTAEQTLETAPKSPNPSPPSPEQGRGDEVSQGSPAGPQTGWVSGVPKSRGGDPTALPHAWHPPAMGGRPMGQGWVC